MKQDLIKQFKLQTIIFKYSVLPLQLKRSFNTAHSASTHRSNFIVSISSQSFNVITGFGQCGLPPKKQNCYLADIQDCFQCMIQLQTSLSKQAKMQQLGKQKILLLLTEYQDSVFKGVDNQFFLLIRNDIKQIRQNKVNEQEDVKYVYLIMLILSTLQNLSMSNKTYLAAKSAIQFAILDHYAKKKQISTSKLIHNISQKNKKCQSFYTLSHESKENMIQNGKYGQQYTKYIKIKFDNNIKDLLQLLQSLDQNKIGEHWIIDANASWSLQDYKYFQKQLATNQKFASSMQKVMFIEQPFPVILNQNQFQPWKQIRIQTKLKIIADQSFSNVADLPKMNQLSHGINIKMEKCGGPIGAARILTELKNTKIQIVMFGSMVSSHLGCTQVYQFKQFAQYFDIDGALLVANPIIKGGFEWNKEEGLIQIEGNGLAIQNLCNFLQ